MIFSNVYIGFDTLEKALNLPDGVKVVTVRESEQQGQYMIVRIVSNEHPQEMTFNKNTDTLAKIGEAYLPQLTVVGQEKVEEKLLEDKPVDGATPN